MHGKTRQTICSRPMPSDHRRHGLYMRQAAAARAMRKMVASGVAIHGVRGAATGSMAVRPYLCGWRSEQRRRSVRCRFLHRRQPRRCAPACMRCGRVDRDGDAAIRGGRGAAARAMMKTTACGATIHGGQGATTGRASRKTVAGAAALQAMVKAVAGDAAIRGG